MDAFSRLLASIGQSLGKGLGQVGQTELEQRKRLEALDVEQRQRLEALEAQRRANVSSQLLQTFTQLLQTQGIQEVAPEGIDAIKQAVTDLALGRIDSPSVQKAVSVFPTVAQAANKIGVYRELATKDLDALSRLVVNSNPDEAQRFLKAVGLEGMYEGLRSRGEILTEADKLGLQLTKEQIENLATQRKVLLAKLEPEIKLLDAQLRLVGAQADEIIAKLPLVLTRLQLEAQNLAVQIRKGEIEASKLDQILDAQIKKDLAQVGVSEAQAEVLREQRGLIREQIKSEVLRQAQTEAETERTKAQTELTKAQAELTKAQAEEINKTLGPRIENLIVDAELKRAQIAGEQARTEEAKARAQAILQKLPLELESLLLDIKKKGVELEKLPDFLDAQLEEIFSRIKLNEAETGLKKEEINLIKEQTKTEILRQLQTEAQTEKTRAETEEIKARKLWVDKQTEELDRRYNLDLARGRTNWFKDLLESFRESGTTDPDIIKAMLTNPLDPFALPEAIAEPLSRDISARVKDAVTLSELQLADATSKTSASLLTLASKSEKPEEAKKFAMKMLPAGVKPELREFIGDLAQTLSTGEIIAKHEEDIKRLLDKPPPPKVSESGMLRDFYDNAVRRFGKAYANSIVNLIKEYWETKRKAQELELAGKSAEAEKDKAMALYYTIQAKSIPEELKLKKEDFDFEKWFKTQQVEQGWARIKLEELQLQAQASGDKNIADIIYKLTTGAKNVGDLARDTLAGRLFQMKAAECAQMVKSGDAQNLAELIAGIRGECSATIANILKNPDDPVAASFASAVAYQQRVIEIASALLNNPNEVQPGATSGGAAPITPSTGGKPSGTAAPGGAPSSTATPKPQGGAITLQGKATELKQAGVPLPNDPKIAGAMTFIYALEGGPRENPFQIIPASGVAPSGPDKGFSAAVQAEPARAKAIAIDSAPALGASWFLPTIARYPSVKVSLLDPKIVEANKPLFDRAKYFGDDGVAVAAAYTAGALEKAGFEIKYTPLFTTLMRTLAKNDLDMLRMNNPLPPEKAKQRYLNMIKSDNNLLKTLIETVRGQYPNLTREQALEKALGLAESLYDATRLSAIGNLALGGGR